MMYALCFLLGAAAVKGDDLWWKWFGANPQELANRRLEKSRRKYEAKWNR